MRTAVTVRMEVESDGQEVAHEATVEEDQTVDAVINNAIAAVRMLRDNWKADLSGVAPPGVAGPSGP